MKYFNTKMIVLFVAFLAQLVFCQDGNKNTMVGLTASVQGGQIDIMLPIKMNNISIAPSFGYMWAEDVAQELRIGVIPRYYLSSEKATPYVGGKLGALLGIPSKGNTTIVDYVAGLSGGGEYFFDEHFSMGIEAQLNITISDDNSVRFGNPGKTNINTATMLFASYYF